MSISIGNDEGLEEDLLEGHREDHILVLDNRKIVWTILSL